LRIRDSLKQKLESGRQFWLEERKKRFKSEPNRKIFWFNCEEDFSARRRFNCKKREV